MKNYFTNITTLEELKKENKRLCKLLHPDNGGSTSDMQELNRQYDETYMRVKNNHQTATGETYTKQTTEHATAYREIIEKIINLITRRF